MPIRAVVTADIVNSTRLKSGEGKNLLTAITKILTPLKYEFYRGDSFQVYVKNPQEALQWVLLCRAIAISISGTVPCDIRASIGLGTVIPPVRNLSTAKGEAFVLSGRAFDNMSQIDKRLFIAINTTQEKKIYEIALDLMATYTDTIFKRMTAKQAAVITELLKGKTQQEIADQFKKSKSTISQLVNTAGWSEIESVMTKFENIIKLLK
jgi:hypothetical protein